MSLSGELELVGKTIAHYRVTAALGAGGMGEVYRATDTKLGRDVALKVLPARLAGDPDRLARFGREGRALAALNHPNIVTIFSVEEAEGIHFLTMELIEGQPLDRLIPANGFPMERIVEIAGAIAEALAAAHEKGIVHRDLKPANVMVTNESRVKVLDFGLAKDVGAETADGATLTLAGRTQAGMVMGTPAYMSPEQVSGRTLDHRSDIFSFGVMVHEMATGHRPFEGRSSAELISSILRDSPASICDTRPELPSDLARVIRRCLEKDPRHRLQTARDVANEFRDLARVFCGPSGVAAVPRAASKLDSGAARADEGFWIAVLPFKAAGTNADLVALAEGLTEEVTTNMSKFSYLRVIARGSAAQYAQRAVDVRTAAKELGARYVMEGSLRQAGTKVRIAAQLVDADSGAGLWAETYDRAFKPEVMLDLLDEVVPRIVATVGDTQGILAHSMTEALRNRDPESLSPYEALLRSFGFHQHVSADEHLAGVTALEHAVKVAPDRADCWAMLSWLYRAEYTHEYNARPHPMDRSLEAARRAVNLAPSNPLAHAALASAHFFRRELGEFRVAAERALALNWMEGYTTAFLGQHFAFSGDWERGCALAERSTQLNSNHPGWYWAPIVVDAYRRGESKRALEYALKLDMPGLWTVQVVLAVVHCQLGQMEQARIAVRDLVALRPDFAARSRDILGVWWQPDMVERMLGDLRKAGLGAQQTPVEALPSSGTVDAQTASGETRSGEGFWIAVLPFKCTGSSMDLKALAEGLSEGVITGLSRFSYLRVIARGSTAKHTSESGDVRAIGKELGARYMMEGSLRQAGKRLRLAVQLVDATTGSLLWAETYEREFSAEAVFEMQDDLVPRIVSTVADAYGALPRSMSRTVRTKPIEELTPYEGLLRSFSYAERVTAEEHAQAKAALERAVDLSPTASDCWAMLSIILTDGYIHGFDAQPGSLGRALDAARRAVDTGSSNHKAHQALAWALFFHKDFKASRVAAERAIALNPMDASSAVYAGQAIAFGGDWERGCELIRRAIELNPNHPGWYWYAPFLDAYRKSDYRAALDIALKIDMPGFPLASVALCAACAQWGDRVGASSALRELLSLRPDYPEVGRAELEKIWDRALVEHLMDGLRKAGMVIRDGAGAAAPILSPTAATGVAVGAPASSGTETSPAPSGAVRAEERFWVAVLPFKSAGSNADIRALAEGLLEGITTGLSRFSYLRVIARDSMAKSSGDSGDVRAIGKDLGARYVMEGSLRRAGNKLRLAVQLVDTASGAHLWAETYERAFKPEALFDLQDDLEPRIVSTVADQDGILPHSMADELRNKGEDDLTAHEAVVRSFGFFKRFTPEEHAKVRQILEAAVRKSPEHGDCWAMLSHLYCNEYWSGFNARPDPLGRGLDAARRAVDVAPANHLSYWALALPLFFKRELREFRVAAERCIELNRMDGSTVAFMGALIAYSGDWDRGCAIAEPASALNPNHAGWHKVLTFYHAYRKGEYREALAAALRLEAPKSASFVAARAAAYGQLGEREAAWKAVKELLAVDPAFAAMARDFYARFLPFELAERLVDGLRKAGLDVPGESTHPLKPAAG